MERYAQVKLLRCEVVVPDLELDFLAKAVNRSSDNVWPGSPSGGFAMQVMTVRSLAAVSGGTYGIKHPGFTPLTGPCVLGSVTAPLGLFW